MNMTGLEHIGATADGELYALKRTAKGNVLNERCPAVLLEAKRGESHVTGGVVLVGDRRAARVTHRKDRHFFFQHHAYQVDNGLHQEGLRGQDTHTSKGD